MSSIAVLVVEDEALLRMSIVDALLDAGFQALEADNAHAALDLLNSNDQIRAVFTDVDMPGSIDGLMLARLVRDRWPPIKIIVTSGHRSLNSEALPVEGRFFGKPYATDDVIASIRDML